MSLFGNERMNEEEKLKEDIKIEKLKIELQELKNKRVKLEEIKTLETALVEEKAKVKELKPKSKFEKIVDGLVKVNPPSIK